MLGNPWIPSRPTARQAAFLSLPHLEAFYGGAGGGGKSQALLMAALQFVRVPGYAALILRRTYRDLSLPGALMDRAHEWLDHTPAHWDDEDHTWRFPSGATLTFGHLESDNDRYRYQSAEFQLIAWDEVTQFLESQYRYLFSRLRSKTRLGLPLRMRSAANPDGVGLAWVRQRFIVEGASAGRPFVPAKLADNPHVDRAAYRDALKELDPVTRARIEDGDWTIRPPGQFFRRAWLPLVDAAPIGTTIRYWDLAATEAKAGSDPDYTAGGRLTLADGRYWLADVHRFRATPGDVEARVKQVAALDGRGTEIWIEQEPGSAGVNTIDHYQRTVLVGYAVRGFKSTGSKIEYAKPASAAAQAGNVALVLGPWIGDFLDELEAFPSGAHDDQVDVLSHAIAALGDSGPLQVW